MIPIQLELTNFLSYRNKATLDFNGIHTACISGANGAGKSSILDGMTWALFGQSRSKSDDDVVNKVAALNGDGAEVRLTFKLEGVTYRVIRRKKARKSARLELQLGVGDGSWKTLSERKLRETQSSIEQLLKMNFDTFINASFFLQGKADEFTMKSAGKRKEILAELIGASEWEERKELVTERRKIKDGELALLDGRIEDIDAEMGETEARETSLVEAQEIHVQIQARLADKEALLEGYRRQAEGIKHQEQRVRDLGVTVTRAEKSLADTQARLTARQQDRAQFTEILGQGDTIVADYGRWEAVDAAWQGWEAKERAVRAVERQLQPHLEAIARAESGLKERLKNLQAQAARVIEMEAEQRAVTVTLAGGQAQLGALAEQLAGLVVQEQAWQATRDVLTEMGGERKLRQQELGQLQHEEKRVARLRKEGEKLAGEVEQLEVAVAELMGEIAGITTQQTRLSQATAEYTSLQNEQPRLIAQMDKMKERIDRLSAETGGECPLCGQPLTDSHRQSVLAEVTGEGKQLGDQYRENKRGIGTLATEIKGLEQQIAGLDGLTKLQQQKSNLLATKHAKIEEVAKQVAVWEAEGAVQLGRVQDMLADDGAFRAQELKVQELAGKIAGKSGLEQQRHVQQQTVSKAEARLGEIERAVTDWQANGVAELANVDTQLQSGDFAVEARAAVARLQGEVVAVAYDEEAHKAVARERDGLKKMPALFQQLKEAEAAVEGLNAGISDLTKQIEEQSNHLAEVLAQKENEANRLAEMTADQPNMMAFEKEVFALRDEEIVANRRVIVAEQKVEALTLQRRRRAQLVEERAELTRHIGRLRVLEKACGRDGVQSLLIEQAIPEIEANANSLLDRLSDGKMSIYFETQKQLKSRKETVETLDIRIIDDAGERPYENFSGGEQFRVNFAVRLALSRLLARRAGARLQTLVIDEGFGSQDPQGRQRLVEAIHTVQEQFKRLLIITHVDELRDAFDTRIEVVKGVGGSQIAVS